MDTITIDSGGLTIHWDFVNSPDIEAAFLKWANAPEPQGVKLFYLGLILEKSGQIKHALKCYEGYHSALSGKLRLDLLAYPLVCRSGSYLKDPFSLAPASRIWI